MAIEGVHTGSNSGKLYNAYRIAERLYSLKVHWGLSDPIPEIRFGTDGKELIDVMVKECNIECEKAEKYVKSGFRGPGIIWIRDRYSSTSENAIISSFSHMKYSRYRQLKSFCLPITEE